MVFPFSMVLSTCQYKREPNRPCASSRSLLIQNRPGLKLSRCRQAEKYKYSPWGPSHGLIPQSWPSEECSACEASLQMPRYSSKASSLQHQLKQPHAPKCPKSAIDHHWPDQGKRKNQVCSKAQKSQMGR